MGRELKRKEAKKNNLDIKKEVSKEPENEVLKLIKIFIYLTLGLVVLYFIVGIFITKDIKTDWFSPKKEDEITINSDYILASEIFKQKESSYYVYFYKFKEINKSVDLLVSSKLIDPRVYKVDLDSDFNKKFIGEVKQSNDINEFKVQDVTIIKIEDNKITTFLNGEKEITNYLNNLK